MPPIRTTISASRTHQKSHNNFDVRFHNEVSGQEELFKGSTRPFNHIITQKRTSAKAKHIPPIQQPYRWKSNTYWIQNRIRQEKQAADLAEQARIFLERHYQPPPMPHLPLINRIQTSSLAERLAAKPTLQELGTKLSIRKDKKIKRQDEFSIIIKGTEKRLERFKKRYPYLDTPIYGRFKLFKLQFPDKCDKYSEQTWRYIRRDCSAIKKIPLGLGEELVETDFRSLVEQQSIFKYE